MEELFFIGREAGKTKIFFLHISKGVKTIWHLGEKYEEVIKSPSLRLSCVQPEKIEGETERQRKGRKPCVHVIHEGKVILDLKDVRFFSEDFSIFLGSNKREIFLLGKDTIGKPEMAFLSETKKRLSFWRMTDHGFVSLCESDSLSLTRLQALSKEEIDKLSENEKRKARALSPKVRIENNGEVILELLSSRFFIESSPMNIDFR